MDARMERIFCEAALAACGFSRSRRADVDPAGGRWVVVYDFPLPRGYNMRTVHLLIRLPADYPLTPPTWFYLPRGLRRADGTQPPHYFEDSYVPPELQVKGWAAGCLHMREWRPGLDPLRGHSLLTYCEHIRRAFRRWLRA